MNKKLYRETGVLEVFWTGVVGATEAHANLPQPETDRGPVEYRPSVGKAVLLGPMDKTKIEIGAMLRLTATQEERIKKLRKENIAAGVVGYSLRKELDYQDMEKGVKRIEEAE